MTWLTENWFWILTFIAFIAMHMFGHGSHGGSDRERSADGKGPEYGMPSVRRCDSALIRFARQP